METHTVYCNNCGNLGHLYRQCRLPVLSYGVICINDGKVLMIRRKDSLSYIEFLRGKYEIDDHVYITKLLNGCSIQERNNLKKLTFNELWEKLWFIQDGVIKPQTERMLKEYKQSKSKLETLQNTHLFRLLEECEGSYTEPEWEFPKGRRSNHESNMKCAIREFQEETDLSDKEYTLLDNVNPLSEEYIGSNGVRYKHIYYLAFYKGNRGLSINSDKFEQFSEIGDISWLTIDECSKRLRKEQSSKQTILQQIDEFTKRWKDDFNLKE
jgi:ADP-ribose pyrophosphatase YjhB (NUDIX family)